MSSITSPVMLDATGHLIVEGFARQNLLLAQMITSSSEATPATVLNEIHEVVRSGEAANVFSIGDQIMLNYNDGTNDYVLPWDIVHFGNVELQDGEIVPGMFIQSHYAMQAVQFDAREAFYVVPTGGMAAGDYTFNVPSALSHTAAGDYTFNVPNALPEGARLVSSTNFYDNGMTNAKINIYLTPTGEAEATQLTVTSGSTGTSLGNLANGAIGTVNNSAIANYGYNRWAQSGLRQFLNTSAAAGAWWTPQNNFDMPPSQLASLPGFMAGFDEAFLNIIKPIRVTTACNTVTDGGITDVTYDTFFPASLEQEYIVPQLSGAEGEYWEYWKQRLGLSSPQAQGTSGTNAAHIRYGYNAKTTAQAVRLRSATRGGASNAWYVDTAGYATNGSAYTSLRSAPACVIC